MFFNADFDSFAERQTTAHVARLTAIMQRSHCVAEESAHFTAEAVRRGLSQAEALMGAQSMEHAAKLQMDYARTSAEDLASGLARLGELWIALAGAIIAPVARDG